MTMRIHSEFRVVGRLGAKICHTGKQTMEDTVKLSSLIAYLVTFTYTLCRAHLCVNDLTLIVVTWGTHFHIAVHIAISPIHWRETRT